LGPAAAFNTERFAPLAPTSRLARRLLPVVQYVSRVGLAIPQRIDTVASRVLRQGGLKERT
jgi:hypothetical protein